MKRVFLLIAFVTTSARLFSQVADIGNGPGIYLWTGDENWSLTGSSSHNNQADGPPGSPYGLQVDPSTPGTLKYGFTAGMGGGYRGDQIIFWVKRPQYWGLVAYRLPTRSSSELLYAASSFDTTEEATAWVTAQWDSLRRRGAVLDSNGVRKNDWRVLAAVGTPHGVPSPSEVSNDFSQRGWPYSNQSFSYDPVANGGLELRASFWTFQRTAGNSQKLTMQDRGPWLLPAADKPPVIISIDLKRDGPSPTATLWPATQTITQGQSATLTLTSSNAASTENHLLGDGSPASVPLSGDVQVTPTSIGTKTYTYTVNGQATLSWVVDDPSAKLTLNAPNGPIDVTNPPRSKLVSVGGKYTLTAENTVGSTTSEIVLVDVSTVSASATVTVNAAALPSTGGTAALSVVPNTRCWADASAPGGFTAYLARNYVGMHGTVSADPGETITTVELQAQSPTAADWQIVQSKPYGSVATTDDSFSFSIDAARGGPTDPKGLIPRDPSLAALEPEGKIWHYRLHVVMQSGNEVYSPDLPLKVILPYKVQALTAQTLPPAGPEGKWYQASDVKSYPVNVLVP